jgi:hypothetical protein
MKFTQYIILVLIVITCCITNCSSRKLKIKENPKIDIAENLAVIAHNMAYTKYDGKSKTETDIFIDGGIVGQNAFKASYGTLESDHTIAVLVFRGTVPTEFSNIKADVKSKLVRLTNKPNKACSKCLVHEGFRDAYKNDLREDLRTKFSPFITNRINSKDPKEKISSIYFIGHSLGGALATLAAYDSGVYLASQNITSVKLGLVTFGAPRVGNADFANFMNSGLGLDLNLRITYKKDPIITVPWEEDYVHCGSEYNFTSHKLYGTGEANVDKSPRTNAWKLIFTIAGNIGDHSEYKNLDDKSVSDIIKFYTTPKKLK